jgi:hypothetical protein
MIGDSVLLARMCRSLISGILSTVYTARALRALWETEIIEIVSTFEVKLDEAHKTKDGMSQMMAI